MFGAEAALNLAQADTSKAYAEILPAEVQVLRIGDVRVVPLPPRSGHNLAAGGGSASPLWLEMLTHRARLRRAAD